MVDDDEGGYRPFIVPDHAKVWVDMRLTPPTDTAAATRMVEQAIAVAMRLVHGTPTTRPVPLFWSEIHHTRIHAYGWFAPERALTGITEADGRISVYGSRDAEGRVHGVVGWNAAPRDFRTGRAAVLSTLPTLISQS